MAPTAKKDKQGFLHAVYCFIFFKKTLTVLLLFYFLIKRTEFQNSI